MTLRLAVLGDSIGYGIGAARPTDTLAERLAAALGAEGRPAQGRVFAVPGARSADLRAQVGRAAPWGPDIAVIVIGANDLTALTPPARAAAALGAAIGDLRAGGAEVVVAPAPDMSAVPHVPIAYRPLVRAGSARLRDAQVRATLVAGGRVADAEGATSAAFAADATLFCADRFHPSSAGYAVIARAVIPAVRAAAAAGSETRRAG